MPRTLLRALLLQRGWTYADYAKVHAARGATLDPPVDGHVTETTVARWCRGEQVPHPGQLRILVAVFSTGADDLLRSTLLAEPRSYAVAEGDQATDGEEAETTHRRDLLKLAALEGATLGAVFSRVNLFAFDSLARAEASDVGARSLSAIDTAVASLAEGYPSTRPGLTLGRAMTWRERVDALLNGRLTLPQRRGLYGLAARLSTVVGWCCHDLGDGVAAEACAVDAREHALHAELPVDAAWAEVARSCFALYSNRAESASESAQRAVSLAPTGSAAEVWAFAALARASARRGDRETFDASMDAAKRALDHTSEQHRGSALFQVDGMRLDSYAASSLNWLGRPREAAQHAQAAMAAYVGAAVPSPTRLAIANLDLAIASTLEGDADEAVARGITALRTTRMTDSVARRAEDLNAVIMAVLPARDPLASEWWSTYSETLPGGSAVPAIHRSTRSTS